MTPAEYFCEVCGVPACYGTWVSLREGRVGRWFCSEHQTRFNPPPAPPRPEIIVPDDIAAMSLAQVQDELRAGKADADRRAALWRRLDDLVRAQR